MQPQVKVRMSAQVFETHGFQSTQDNLVTSVCVLSCQRAIRQHQEKIAILLGPIRVTDSHPWIALPYGVYFLQHGAVICFPSMLVVELSSTSRQNTRNVPIPDTNEGEAFTQLHKAVTIMPADAGQDPDVVVCRYGYSGLRTYALAARHELGPGTDLLGTVSRCRRERPRGSTGSGPPRGRSSPPSASSCSAATSTRGSARWTTRPERCCGERASTRASERSRFRAASSSARVVPPSRVRRIRAEIHSVRVPHHTTIDASSTRICRTVREVGSCTQSGTTADDVSQNFTSSRRVRARPRPVRLLAGRRAAADPRNPRAGVSARA